MSSFQWCNNCILKLHAKNDYSKIAKLPEFVVWKDGVDRSMQAVGGAFVMHIINYFETSPVIIPTFADVGVPVDAQGHVDYESETFVRA
eukprot:3595307-Rhodomonas_salina.1